jgi:hypothetical protein
MWAVIAMLVGMGFSIATTYPILKSRKPGDTLWYCTYLSS